MQIKYIPLCISLYTGQIRHTVDNKWSLTVAIVTYCIHRMDPVDTMVFAGVRRRRSV